MRHIILIFLLIFSLTVSAEDSIPVKSLVLDPTVDSSNNDVWLIDIKADTFYYIRMFKSEYLLALAENKKIVINQ